MSDSLSNAVRAVLEGDAQALAIALPDAPEAVSFADPLGRSLLGLACRVATGDGAIPPVPSTEAQLSMVQQLLDAGVDPARADQDGCAPLHLAAITGNCALAEVLIAGGAPRDGRLMGAEGGSALALALFYAQTEVAQVLADPAVPDNLRAAACLSRPLDRFLRSDGGLTEAAGAGRDFYRPAAEWPEATPSSDPQEILDEALAYAARHGATTSMARLVELGADLNANPYRGTALLWAIYADSVPAAAWLLDRGADPDLRHDFGGSEHGKQAVAMHLAAQFSSLGCLELLLERGADPTVRDGSWDGTPLDWARECEQPEAVARLERAR